MLNESNTNAGKKGVEGKSTTHLSPHACIHPIMELFSNREFNY